MCTAYNEKINLLLAKKKNKVEQMCNELKLKHKLKHKNKHSFQIILLKNIFSY